MHLFDIILQFKMLTRLNLNVTNTSILESLEGAIIIQKSI
jgi:hypothetical protein